MPSSGAVSRRCLITGITGQDGSYLAEFLLERGYDVHGMINSRLEPAGKLTGSGTPAVPSSRVHLHEGDLDDPASITRVIEEVLPDEVYNLAAMSDVRLSFSDPAATVATNGGGTLRLLDSVRVARPGCRFFQASSAEMFGEAPPPLGEGSPLEPRSPYGSSKLFSHWLTVNARQTHGLHAVSGILFNHESPRRGPAFVTRKISQAVARIKAGLQTEVMLGNLEATRDWGYAPEYVEAMWLMLQRDEPEDFVLATGVGTTVAEFAEAAFAHAGLDWAEHVRVDETLLRPPEQFARVGDPRKAEALLGWKAQTYAGDLAGIMVDADIALLGGES